MQKLMVMREDQLPVPSSARADERMMGLAPPAHMATGLPSGGCGRS